MSMKEKGGFDFGDIGVKTVTHNILSKRVEEKKEEPPKVQHEAPKPAPVAEPVRAMTEELPKPPTPKKVKEPKKVENILVKTSYQLKQGQIDAMKRIAAHTNKDMAEVIRQIVDFGLEKVEKKNPDLLKEIEVKEIF